MRYRIIISLVGILTLISATDSFARRGKGSSGGLSMADGIVHPGPFASISTAKNPAGLIGNMRFGVNATLGSPTDSFNPLTINPNIFFGGKSIGGGVGYQTSTASGSADVVAGGFAFKLGKKFVLGANASYLLTAPVLGDRSDLSGGFLYNPEGKFKVGGIIGGIIGGLDEIGLGFSYDFGKSFTFVTDVSANGSAGALSVKPALEIRLGKKFSLMGGYGISLTDPSAGDSRPVVVESVEVGAGFNTGKVIIEAYYQHIQNYVLSMTVMF